jgi:S1-C subfamily serine protease
MAMEEVRRVKAQFTDLLLAKSNVVGCGVGYKEVAGTRTGELCVVVSVAQKVSREQLAPEHLVPQALEGVRTDVQETGVIRALQGRTDKWRPAPGGVSCGHVAITAGTLGCLVTRGGQVYILSNNHVLADSNQGQPGDPILQPGPHDGGTLADQIATLEEFVPINFGTDGPTCPIATGLADVFNGLAQIFGSRHRMRAFQENPEMNLVDAAIARPLSTDLVEKRILEIGEPQGVGEGTLGLRIRKSGRTTGLTSGEITQVDATVRVGYGAGNTATFTDQLIAGPMSSGGDSGSAVLDEDGRVVGLLFAGSSSTTVINRIQNVLDALNVSVDP